MGHDAAKRAHLARLDESTEEAVGKLLVVDPDFIDDWPTDPDDFAEAIRPYRVRLERLWWREGIRSGGLAIVEEPGHALDGHWAVIQPKHAGTYDFEDRSGIYYIFVYEEEPTDLDELGAPRKEGAYVVNHAPIADIRLVE